MGTCKLSTLMAVCLIAPAVLRAQGTGRAGDPLVETSAGRALQRILFANIDCDPVSRTFDDCARDTLAKSGVFSNGRYQGLRSRQFALGGVDVTDTLMNRFVTQGQTFPTSSSASGFTFSIGQSGIPTLDSELYSPLYGERALTNGKGKASLAFTWETLRWDSMDGSKIRNDDNQGLVWGDVNYDGLGGSYAGLCLMDINMDVYTAAVSLGVTGRFDVRVSVPLVHSSVEGSNEFMDFVASGNQATNVGITFNPQGRYYVRGESNGIGDMEVGVKYAFLQQDASGLAVTAGARLGTGSFDKMTGTGRTQGKVALVGSYDGGRFSPHFHAGYNFGASGQRLNTTSSGVTLDVTTPDEFTYGLGVGVQVIRKRLTFGAELVSRRVFDLEGFVCGQDFQVVGPSNNPNNIPLRSCVATKGDVNLFFATAGFKWRVAGQLLASTYTMFAFGNDALQPTRPSLNLGLNYAF